MYDNIVKEVDDYSWDELVETFSTHRRTEDKNDLGFVLGRFKPAGQAREATRTVNEQKVIIPNTVGRYGENIIEMEALCIDYDGGATIDEVRAQLKGIRHLGYTSYNHLKDGVTQKFRVIIPFTEPCPGEEWRLRNRGFLELFPGCDQVSFTLGRIFYAPSTPLSETRTTVAWSEDGKALDWRPIARAEPKVYRPVTFIEGGAEHRDAQTEVHTKDWGVLTARALYDLLRDGYDHRVNCYKLDGSDRNPSCFIYRSGNGLRYFGTDGVKTFIRVFEEVQDGLTLVRKDVISEPEADEVNEVNEVVRPQERQFSAPTKVAARLETVKQFVRRVMVGGEHFVLRTAEGYGKSTSLVQSLVAQGCDVLFCCSSNEQANKKVADLQLYGAERAWSTRSLIKQEVGVDAIFKEAHGEWDAPAMDVEATAEVIAEKLQVGEDDALEVVKMLSERARASQKSKARVLVTTFATGDRLRKAAYGRLERVIVVDDPSTGDLLTKKVELGKEGYEVVAEREVKDVIFGEDFFGQDRIIWTTTEKVVMDLIRHQHPQAVIKDVEEAIETHNRVLLYPTWLVRSSTKKVLPGIHECVKETTKQVPHLIANGARAELNLVSTKGRNDLRADSVIIISYPHPNEVGSVAASLDKLELRTEVMSQMVTDVLDQAIGRAQGYRTRDDVFQTLVLCDPNLETTLRWRSRYRLVSLDGLKRRGRLGGVPLIFYDAVPAWWCEWFAYITTWQRWVKVIGGKVFCTITLEVICSADDFKRQEKLIKRPTQFVQETWKLVSEHLPEDGSRRNLLIQLLQLVNETNVSQRASSVTKRNKEKPPVKGLGWWHDPATGKQGRMTTDKAAALGWSKGRLKKDKT